MHLYTIQIGTKASPRLSLQAMARDSMTAALEHLGLCEQGERVEVLPNDYTPKREARAAAHSVQQMRRMALNCGECPDCGERLPTHESDCPNRPYCEE